uniref:Uncharacterized protein n=1 Tax=Micrurus paraensis TaxID=1970185 RepID=A0A2D4KQQ6_9SAUR
MPNSLQVILLARLCKSHFWSGGNQINGSQRFFTFILFMFLFFLFSSIQMDVVGGGKRTKLLMFYYWIIDDSYIIDNSHQKAVEGALASEMHNNEITHLNFCLYVYPPP